ncbi:uncharacterized protein LOC143283507 [Babylonia areolata]|uniref:uncharacterized protein LOC143283507 n=1 Tax=Babylonia areolata TaxID=304850 RepID=UPI003FCFACB9
MADDLEEEGIIEDWSRQGLWILDLQPSHAGLTALYADHNCITKLDTLHVCPRLQQLSLAHNRLVEITGLSPLTQLTVLNLAANSISSIQGLESLSLLTWVDLSGNSIEDMAGLSACHHLRYLDVSENSISALADLRSLTVLKTLLLHENNISSLTLAPYCLPVSVRTLSLEANSVEDLTQMTSLVFLTQLEQLSVAQNPCVQMTANKEYPCFVLMCLTWFDYRPYLLCCCPSLQVLDGFLVQEAERQQAVWLYQQGYIQHMLPGQHVLMVTYLATVCPLVSAPQLQTQQDACLSRLVSKQQHQQQPLPDNPQLQPPLSSSSSSPSLSSLSRSPLPWSYNRLQTLLRSSQAACDPSVGEARASVVSPRPGDVLNRADSPVHRLTLSSRTDPRAYGTSSLPGGAARKGQDRQDLCVQDLAPDDCDARSNHSQLESESVYLPVGGGNTPTPASPSPVHTTTCLSPSLLQLQARLSISLPHPTSTQPPSSSAPPLSSVSSSPTTASSVSSPRTSVRPPPPTTTTKSSPETKYELKERRVIRPLNQEIVKGKLRTNFPVSVAPQASDAEPRAHTPRADRPPTAHCHDYDDMSLDASHPHHHHQPPSSSSSSSSPHPAAPSPSPSPTPGGGGGGDSAPPAESGDTVVVVPPAAVSLIHRVADFKRSSRHHQQTARHTPPPSGPASSHISTQQQQQQQQQQVTKAGRSRVKALDSNRQTRIELSKMLKCQQNAERLNQHRDRPAPGLQLSTDSGFQSRPASDAVLTDYGEGGHRAASVIQAVWRGYWAREHSLEVVSIRKEIRARRAEDHIVLLRADLDRHKKLYDEEKRLRTLQMEAIRLLYQEVQQLKAQVQGPASNSRPGTADSMLSTGSATLGQSNASTGSNLSDLQRTAELERTCHSLQNQVTALRNTLYDMTDRVLRQDSVELHSLPTTADIDKLKTVRVLECQEGPILSPHMEHQTSACHWSSIPHSLSPYPSEEEEVYFRQVPHHGAPTPPRKLGLQHKSEQSVLLHWLPSRLSMDHTSDPKSSVTGYCVYIDDQPKGTVSNQKTMALVCGLCPSATYKFYIRAVSGVGESYESNIVIARLARGSERQQRLSDSSDSDVLPDSDKDHDSSDVTDKRRLRNKREGRKSRKARSPRSDKKTTAATAAKTSVQVEEGRDRESGGGGGGGQREGRTTPHRQQQEEAAGIPLQAKLHRHRRNSSKEQSELSSLQSDSTPSTTPSRPGEDTQRGGPPTRSTPPSSRSTPPPPPARSTPTKELMQPGAVLTQPDVVRQRRAGSPARDLSFKSPSPSLERKGGDRSSPGSQDGEPRAPSAGMEDAASEIPVVLSETFDVDKAKSYLRNLTTPPPRFPADSPGSAEAGGGGYVKGHQRKRSKDFNAESSGASSHKDRSSPDRTPSSSGQPETPPGEDGARVKHTHRRTRSRDLTTPTSMDEVGRGEEDGGGGGRDKERSNTPVLDARQRTTGSRPSSPMIFDGPPLASTEHREPDSPLAELSRRKTNAENLIQRFRKSPSSSTVSGGKEGEEKVSPQYGNRSRKQSPPVSDSQPDSHEESGRSHSTRSRTRSVGSEHDLMCVEGERKLYTSDILNKLNMTVSKMAESHRLRKRSSEEEPHRRTRHVSESDNDISSDPGSHLPPKAPPVASDSSSGSHSDDNKARHHHRHRRSPSDQRPLTAASASGYSSDQVSGRHTHSPIIMEGGGKKGGSGLRRNASCHAVLPSRPPESQPSPAPEDTASGGGGSSQREEVTNPQESQGNPRSSIRSRSPSPGPNRQPILSGAQLKRHTSDVSKPSS